jgi:hypothetical protein
MVRYQTICNHCGFASDWNHELRVSAISMVMHLQGVHNMAGPDYSSDYQIAKQRQCDFCLEEYLDDCTKCRQDFCRFHAGDIDGLCGGCI